MRDNRRSRLFIDRDDHVVDMIAGLGFPSIRAFCLAHRLNLCQTYNLVNKRLRPLDKHGRLTATARRLCDALGSIPEDVFDYERRELWCEQCHAGKPWRCPDYRCHYPWQQSHCPDSLPSYGKHLIDAQEQTTPAQAIMDAERDAAVQAAIEALPPRERLAAASWFGLDGMDQAANVSAVGRLIGSDHYGATKAIYGGIRRLAKPLAWLKPG